MDLTEPLMTDKLGRTIDYLRLSVTDRCNLNCAYCKHSDSDGKSIVTFGEIAKIIRLFAECGVRKIRLTGGEPLVRGDIVDIVKICGEAKGIKEVTLTTNGILLPEMAADLKTAGLTRINISIDSLNPAKYKKIARAEGLADTLRGVEASIEAGLTPVKINTVLMRGVNENEIDDFIELTKDRDIHVRFIEYMPMGKDNKELYISAQEIISARPDLVKCGDLGGVEVLYKRPGYRGKIGFITPVSRPFCEKCNRIRVTADCKIRYCLGSNMEENLREILIKDDETALMLIKEAVANKPQKGFCAGFVTERGMGNIGG
jgi:cyclic pyranopterin phosphate synthase